MLKWIPWQWKSSRIRQQFYRQESFAMKTDILMNGSMVKNHISLKNGIRIQCNTENFVPVVVPGLSTSSSSSSYHSTSMTPSRQERHCSTSSSSSSSSPTTATSSDNETREREDRTENDTSPVPVSSFNVDDRTEQPVVGRESNHEQIHQANQNFSKTNLKETMIERGNPLSADSRSRKLWNPGVAARIQGTFGGWWNSSTWKLSRQFFSWSLFRAHIQGDVRIWVSTVFILISLKTEIARSVKGPDITKAPCRRRNGGGVPRAENFGDLITADHKVF